MSTPAGERPRPELRITRVFDAPRSLVFRCMIDPDQLTHFWGPEGVSTPRDLIAVDARVGGEFSAVMVNDSDGSRYPFLAEYLEVAEPERLVWRDRNLGVVTTSTFTAVDDSHTRVEIVQTDIPETFLDPAAQAGFLSSLDRLQAYLQALTPSVFPHHQE